MAGHSKWANIQHRKGAQDAKRAKIFTKLIREITSATRVGGKDQETNPRLRLAIHKALDANMTRDAIDRAVKRGTGEIAGSDFSEAVYEGYGPGGAAIMVDCLTDNKIRTVSDVRAVFTKHNGNLGVSGSVSYLFKKIGVIRFVDVTLETQLFDVAIEAGADDIIVIPECGVEVVTRPDTFELVVAKLREKGFSSDAELIEMQPITTVAIDAECQLQLDKMLEKLDSLDDVQEVYTNARSS
ncbi:MAG: YebC/PmpR family DNA-binding transcriptional regulator [Methylacidiphilales bacterium]|nr:YebC/PmpR family DNA-binding transcriptional regulator [Candidatus Methylacidiphilales bacterium]